MLALFCKKSIISLVGKTTKGHEMATKTKARKPIMIFIGCWLCGETFQIAERDYNHGAVCGDCIKGKK